MTPAQARLTEAAAGQDAFYRPKSWEVETGGCAIAARAKRKRDGFRGKIVVDKGKASIYDEFILAHRGLDIIGGIQMRNGEEEFPVIARNKEPELKEWGQLVEAARPVVKDIAEALAKTGEVQSNNLRA